MLTRFQNFPVQYAKHTPVTNTFYWRNLTGRNEKRASFTLTLLILGADETNRTPDLLITNQLLYRLSYISEDAYSIKKFA